MCLVLADAPTALASIDWTNTGLTDIHEGIGDPAELLADFREHSVDVGWLTDVLDSEDDVRTALLALPRQVVHGDVAASNALLHGHRVTGVIDFEIAGLDARVSEVGTALLTLGGAPTASDGRARICAIRDAFDRVLDLSDAEIEMLPEVVRQRLAGSVLWRAGRWRNGDAGIDEVVTRLRDGETHVRQLAAYRR